MKHAIPGALLCVIACSTPSGLPAHGLEALLPAGAYTLRTAPLVSDRAVTCSDSDRYLGVAIQAFVTVKYDGNVLVVGSTTALDGNLEMRISEAGLLRLGSTLVSGTARGTAVDRRYAETTGIATLGFASGPTGAASLTGTLETYSTPYLLGDAVGTFPAESSLGHETCQRALWRLDPL